VQDGFHIEGVDVQAALVRVRGKIDSYKKLAGLFRGDGLAKLGQIEASFTGRDIAAYSFFAHTLRGSAATIGADGFAAVCGELEAAGKRRDWDFIAARHAAFMSALRTLLADIGAALGEV